MTLRSASSASASVSSVASGAAFLIVVTRRNTWPSSRMPEQRGLDGDHAAIVSENFHCLHPATRSCASSVSRARVTVCTQSNLAFSSKTLAKAAKHVDKPFCLRS